MLEKTFEGLEKSGGLLEKVNEMSEKSLNFDGLNCSLVKEMDISDGSSDLTAFNSWSRDGLTETKKQDIKKEWPDEVVDSIGSMEELQIYKDAGLVECKIEGKSCLVRSNIDMEQKDGFGRTNKERMEQGFAPLDPDGRPYELHHIGQHQDSPLAELTMQEHRGKENFSVLHHPLEESEIDREAFNHERAEHWKNRVDEVKNYE